ncbi:hypothetical protein KGM_208085 [Danaus plexippus plexippus]|uniref:Uncharacterized protein n=1 Tax=Danaus plexippus plexippus TaxID=278856 RepID=A0A212FDJ7_DANPL|nr:hypothetical protein KGM_208085 [Danaus plexippus plexippus]
MKKVYAKAFTSFVYEFRPLLKTPSINTNDGAYSDGVWCGYAASRMPIPKPESPRRSMTWAANRPPAPTV